ncbi:hypothetical protein CC1G_02227 [Coprinopsis cinerea okayama7|uniref:Uncharacterized protein n=1 Tax=Coprinopsis cinerea (strain Okayama-7 / 130 / ATCC MYA-4618 / FGSC 9003) TaxID=240176 RepID=A8NKM3_COPC7|nr:hypothetical protein CC1G_02227 [Coprinopsis cinerea okayama7\|eukprot:XP_001834491.2 hypothetical protein CC1G_02227 [Coprinopsis cinerea okayama7\
MSSTTAVPETLNGNPPTLKTPNVVSDEPSNEWASNTLGAITDDKTSSTTTQEKPQPNVEADIGYVKGVAASAIETAKEYVGAAGDKVAPYLPQSVAGYVGKSHSGESHPERNPNHGFDDVYGESIAKCPEERRLESLPSHDDESQTPLGHSGGVGRLPGSSDETGVAVLPDERKGEAEPNHGFDDVSGGSIAKLPEESRLEVLPSRDDDRLTPLGHTGGAGPLPGSITEAGVAVLPDEHKAGAAASLEPDRTNREPFTTTLPKPKAEPQTAGGPVGPSTRTQFLDAKPQDQEHKPSPPLDMSQNASTNASIKTLPGSKLGGQSDEELETLREHTSGAPRSGAAGVQVSPTSHGKPHDRVKETLTEKPIVTTTNVLPEATAQPRDKHTVEDSPATKGLGQKLDTTSPNKPVNTTAREHPVEGNRPPPVPEKAQPDVHHLDSGRATAGHSTTGLTDWDHPTRVQKATSTPNADAATSYPSGTKHTTSAGAADRGEHVGSGGAGLSAGTARQPRASPGSPPKKHGFMDKIKGEAKVISGKLGKNESKVEEGKKLMGKN